MTYSLTFRQSRVYRHTVTIIRPVTTITNGDVGDQAFQVVDTLVPCHLIGTQNDSDPTGAAARLKRRSMLTEDHLRLPLTADIQDGDYIFDTTVTSDPPNYLGKVQGSARSVYGSANRTCRFKAVQLMEEEKAPAGVLALV